jgi:choline dehydrogenase-like flavoprotein
MGAELKEALTEPGSWSMNIGGFGETLPYHENKITLDKTKKDKWGLNILAMDIEYKDNEVKMRKDMVGDAVEMLEAVGVKNVKPRNGDGTLGRGIHEMGTARMGKDSKTSVLNKYNQVWDAMNVFVTDGSFMVSSACHNPITWLYGVHGTCSRSRSK